MTIRLGLRLSMLAAALAAATGAAFALWAEHGPRMFMALVESGLSWCF